MVKDLSAPHTALLARRIGTTRRWEEAQTGQLTLADKKTIPNHMTSCSVHELVGEISGDHCLGITWTSVSRSWEIALYNTWFVYCNLTITIIIIYPLFSILLNSPYFHQKNLLFSDSLPRPSVGRRMRKWLFVVQISHKLNYTIPFCHPVWVGYESMTLRSNSCALPSELAQHFKTQYHENLFLFNMGDFLL